MISSPSLEQQFPGPAARLLPWMNDPLVADILVNGTSSAFVERSGRLEAIENPFASRTCLVDWIERLLVPLGKRVDALRPYADGRCSDGTRFHVILPPVAVDGPIVSLRKRAPTDAYPLECFGEPEVMRRLQEALVAGSNILIAGGTGSGKTTLLTRLLERLPSHERLVVVEESWELRPAHPHAVHLEGRPPTPDGTGEVGLRELLRNALRMRPDRLVLGECRGPEAFELLQAWNTGHRGSVTTIHASGARDALRRLESLVLIAGIVPSPLVVRSWIAASVNLIAYLERRGGRRRVVELMSVKGLEGDVYRCLPEYPRARVGLV